MPLQITKKTSSFTQNGAQAPKPFASEKCNHGQDLIKSNLAPCQKQEPIKFAQQWKKAAHPEFTLILNCIKLMKRNWHHRSRYRIINKQRTKAQPIIIPKTILPMTNQPTHIRPSNKTNQAKMPPESRGMISKLNQARIRISAILRLHIKII